MNYQEFLESIVSEMKLRLGEHTTIDIVQIDKNNGVKLDGLIIRQDSVNMAPAIYLNQYYGQYKEGRAIADITEDIHRLYLKYACNLPVRPEDFTDYRKLHRRVSFKLINYKENSSLLSHIPYVRFCDLAIVFYVSVCCNADSGLENAVFLIREEHLLLWKIDIGDLYRDALYNTPDLFPASICSMTDMICSLLDKSTGGQPEQIHPVPDCFAEYEMPVYILTNSKKVNGASCILYKDLLRNFACEKNENFYIIPSSIHEVLLVPESQGLKMDELKSMVQEVNDTELDREEILSYSVYYYNRELDCILEEDL